MDLTLLNLLPILAVIGLIFIAVRAHEQYWTLGFLGWRKVYAGLGLYLFAGLLYAVEFWLLKSSPTSTILPVLNAGILISGVAGLALVLAGSIERLRELSAERMRLEDIRAGFDLFDSLREIIAQPYSFLEVLDYALKEMVRAAGVDSGGLWLYNAKKPEWVLTGWANMPEKLRQQTESITGSGTGFDRLASAHKARLFSAPEKIRVFFPEWEAEGYQSILGMPLASGAVGSAGRQILGAIVLCDRSAERFDDDRARRLYAASDYVAAVIAEARITRQLDAARQQLDGAYAKLEQERREASRQKQEALEQLEQLAAKRNDDEAALKSAHTAQLAEAKTDFEKQLNDLRIETDERLTAHKTQADELLSTTKAGLENRLADQKSKAGELLQTTKAELENRLANQTLKADELLQTTKAELENRLAEQKSKAGELLQATRAESEKRLANEKAFATEKLHTAQAEFERRLADEKSRAAEELLTTKADLEKRLLTETTRVEQLQARWEEVSRSAEQLEKRMETERAGWEKRLDELHRELRSETERARKREAELAGEHRAYVNETDTLFGDLEQELETEKQKVTERSASLQTARASLTERESALASERAARAEAAASHRAALGALEARLKTLESQLQTEQQRAASYQEEVKSAETTIAELEATMETEHRDQRKENEMLAEQLATARTSVSQLEAALDTARREHEALASAVVEQVTQAQQTAGVQLHSAEREIQSLRLMLEDREAQLAARHEAEREAMEEIVRVQKVAAQEQKLAARTAAQLEDELNEERMRRESAEHDVGILRSEWTDFETRREREIVEERLTHRRQMHNLETVNGSLTQRARRLLAIPSGAERVAAALRCVGDRLPPNTQLYFWQRQSGGAPHMVAWQDGDAHVFRGHALPPWPFEINTIPAEGVMRLTSPGQWESLRHEQFNATLEGWLGHWGESREPRWAVCWPWGSSAQESNGWVTAFGFGDVLITDQQIDEAETWVGYLAAALAGTSGSDLLLLPEPEITPAEADDVLPEPEVNLLGSENAIIRPGDDAALETVATYAGEIAAIDQPEEELEMSEIAQPETEEEQPALAEEEESVMAEEQADNISTPHVATPVTESELHHAVIQWAADQIDDAFNLDLTARPGVPVDGGWLRRALERGRSSCRQSNQPRVEFDVSTMNENGWTVLRLIRSSESSPGAGSGIAAVEDSDLSASASQTDSTTSEREPIIPVSGRWLLHGGSTIGMELRFTTKHLDEPGTKNSIPSQNLTSDSTILVINDRESMGELLTGMIEALGGQTFTAGDFERAQEQIASNEIHIAVVDTTMADDSGWRIARRLVESNPQIPVLLIIGSDTVSIPDDAAGHWLLRMPFQIDELRECLEGVFAARSHEDTLSQTD